MLEEDHAKPEDVQAVPGPSVLEWEHQSPLEKGHCPSSQGWSSTWKPVTLVAMHPGWGVSETSHALRCPDVSKDIHELHISLSIS